MGFLGADRFYLGKIGTGLLKFLTMGGLGIWYLMDLYKVLNNKTVDIKGKALDGKNYRDPVILIYLTVFGGVIGLNYFYLRNTKLGLIKLGLVVLTGITPLLAAGMAYSMGQTGAVIGGILTFLPIAAVGVWYFWDIYLFLTGGLKDSGRLQISAQAEKFQGVALLLAFTGGTFGFDRFYLGHRMGMLKLFTFGLGGVWVFLDIIFILMNNLKTVDGKDLIQS